MDTLYPNKGFEPIKCYEELRFNVLDDPFFTSQGKYLLQNRGMFWWLKTVETLNTKLEAETVEIEQDLFNPVFSPGHEEGFRNSLSILLADIVLNIQRGVNYE